MAHKGPAHCAKGPALWVSNLDRSAKGLDEEPPALGLRSRSKTSSRRAKGYLIDAFARMSRKSQSRTARPSGPSDVLSA